MTFGNGNLGWQVDNSGGGPPPPTPSWQDTLDVGNTTHTELDFIDFQTVPPYPALQSKTWMRIRPIALTGVNDTDFWLNQIAQQNFANGLFNGGNNNVVSMGWNLSPGGGPVVAGVAGIGDQWEGNYFPEDQQFVERHIFYITPAAGQTRLQSFTVRSATNNIDLYHTAGFYSLRSPDTFAPFYSLSGGANTVEQGYFDLSSLDNRRIIADFSGAFKFLYIGLYSGNNDFAITRFTDGTIDSLGLTFSAGFAQFKTFGGGGIILPDLDNATILGRADLRWATVVGVKGEFNMQSYISAAADPTPADIEDGFYQMYLNSGSGVLKLWANQGGVMKSVTLT